MPKTLTRSLILMISAILVAVSVGAVVSGQTPAQTATTTATTPPPAPAAPPARTTPPDQTAYTAALAVKDPVAKIDAIKKFKTDFPTSSLQTAADNALLDALIAGSTNEAEILKALNVVVGNISPSAPGQSRLTQIQNIVLKLADKKVLLDKAEALVGEALEYLDTDMKATFKKAQAQGIEALAAVHLAKGDSNRAEKEFKDAFAANPTLTRAPVELAQLASKRGNDKLALEYYLPLAARGLLKTADEAGFRASYAKVHGSAADLEKELDHVYRDLNPIGKIEGYKKTSARTNRLVLAEMFTGAGCGPCVSADLALDKVIERYNENDVIAIAYHANIPLPDPMVVAGGDVRRVYYAVPGVPTLAVDGTSKVGGGAWTDAPRTYGDYVKMFDKALETAPAANVTVRATTDGTKIKVTATASNVKSDAKDLKLQVVLTEHELRFVGENGIRLHALVVRDVAGENHGGFKIDASGQATAEWTFDIAAIGEDLKKTLAAEMTKRRATETAGSTPREYKADGHAMVDINASELSIVAFVQETRGEGAAMTRQVLQAAHAPVTKTATQK